MSTETTKSESRSDWDLRLEQERQEVADAQRQFTERWEAAKDRLQQAQKELIAAREAAFTLEAPVVLKHGQDQADSYIKALLVEKRDLDPDFQAAYERIERAWVSEEEALRNVERYNLALLSWQHLDDYPREKQGPLHYLSERAAP